MQIEETALIELEHSSQRAKRQIEGKPCIERKASSSRNRTAAMRTYPPIPFSGQLREIMVIRRVDPPLGAAPAQPPTGTRTTACRLPPQEADQATKGAIHRTCLLVALILINTL